MSLCKLVIITASAENAGFLQELSAEAVNLKPAVTTILPRAQAVQAHELSQAGHVRGKIVLQVSD